MRLACPAKLNLFLAITGRRPDGFHNLVSLVTPVEWGDTLDVELTATSGFSLTSDHPEVPLDASNLVLRAATAFAVESGIHQGARFHLSKRVPIGAGLGGGSSNAVSALVSLNQLHGTPLSPDMLERLAASLGSDCVLFLRGGPQVMRGRGEIVTQVTNEAKNRLSGQSVLLFKPEFGIATAWSYREMAARAPALYLEESEAEKRLTSWLNRPGDWSSLLYNNMESVAFEKHSALPVLLNRLRAKFDLACAMSGSGSACFAVLDDRADLAAITACIQDAWGPKVFIEKTKIS